MAHYNDKILEAYTKMYSSKLVKENTETVVTDEGDDLATETVTTSSNTMSSDNTSGETIKEADDSKVASTPGYYSKFTGKIRTPGVYGSVQDASFTIEDNNNVSWSKGIWLDGTWASRGSIWNGGTWKNGTWKTGYWGGGTWEDGLHLGGIFAGGIWKNGTWDYGTFDAGIWEDGIWKEGDWSAEDTEWIKGRDSKGEEHSEPPFKWGNMKYSKNTDVANYKAKKERSPYYKGEYKTGDKGLDTFEDDPNKQMAIDAHARGYDDASAPAFVESISESTKKHLMGTKILGKFLK